MYDKKNIYIEKMYCAVCKHWLSIVLFPTVLKGSTGLKIPIEACRRGSSSLWISYLARPMILWEAEENEPHLTATLWERRASAASCGRTEHSFSILTHTSPPSIWSPDWSHVAAKSHSGHCSSCSPVRVTVSWLRLQILTPACGSSQWIWRCFCLRHASEIKEKCKRDAFMNVYTLITEMGTCKCANIPALSRATEWPDFFSIDQHQSINTNRTIKFLAHFHDNSHTACVFPQMHDAYRWKKRLGMETKMLSKIVLFWTFLLFCDQQREVLAFFFSTLLELWHWRSSSRVRAMENLKRLFSFNIYVLFDNKSPSRRWWGGAV